MSLRVRFREYAAILFDCDGTLVKTEKLNLHTLHVALGSLGLLVEDQWCLARTGLSARIILSQYERDFKSLPVPHEEILLRMSVAFRQNVAELEEITMVANIARAAQGIIPIAVGSNGARENVLSSLESVHLLHLFQEVVTAEDVKEPKPQPDIYLEAARRLIVAPNRCLVLEDSDEGIMAAEAAGMKTTDVRLHMTHAFSG